jgi:methylglyoxal synthase
MEKFDIGFTADDSKKEELVNLVRTYREAMEKYSLVATRNTGRMIQHATGLQVAQMHSGLLGGHQQLCTLVTNGNIKVVISLQDPLIVHPEHHDIAALNRICNIYNIQLATNMSTAEAVLHHFFDKKHKHTSRHQIPEYACDLIGVHS